MNTALPGERLQLMIFVRVPVAYVPWVVGVVIASFTIDSHIGLPWTAGGKVRNLDFTTEDGCARLVL